MLNVWLLQITLTLSSEVYKFIFVSPFCTFIHIWSIKMCFKLKIEYVLLFAGGLLPCVTEHTHAIWNRFDAVHPCFVVLHSGSKKWKERKSAHQDRTMVTDGDSLWTLASSCLEDAHSDSWKTHVGHTTVASERLCTTPYLLLLSRTFLQIRTKHLWIKLLFK